MPEFELEILGQLGAQSTRISELAKSTGTAAPTTGTWAVGDKVWNTEPSATEYVGWICVSAGTPGTWKGFGVIQS
jgi:hypothetical protein